MTLLLVVTQEIAGLVDLRLATDPFSPHLC
jgi:hypothetical protein